MGDLTTELMHGTSPTQLAAEFRHADTERIRKRIGHYFPELPFDKSAPLPAEVVTELRRVYERKKGGKAARKVQVAPRPKIAPVAEVAAVEVPRSAPVKIEAPRIRLTELDAINFLDMGLIVVGLWRLYEVPGGILALMLCLFLYKAQTLAKAVELTGAADRSLEVVESMCWAAFVLHSITFWWALPMETPDPYTLVFWVHLGAACLPAGFVSYISFNAVATTRRITDKN